MAGKRTERLALLLAPSAPDSLAAWIRRYITHLETQHRSVADQRTRRSRLAHFNAWCVERSIETPQAVTHAHVERFQRHLFLYRKANGQPIAVNGQRITLFTVENVVPLAGAATRGAVQSLPIWNCHAAPTTCASR